MTPTGQPALNLVTNLSTLARNSFAMADATRFERCAAPDPLEVPKKLEGRFGGSDTGPSCQGIALSASSRRVAPMDTPDSSSTSTTLDVRTNATARLDATPVLLASHSDTVSGVNTVAA